MKIVFQDTTFSLQLLRTIGETYYKGGSCLCVAIDQICPKGSLSCPYLSPQNMSIESQ